MAIVKKDRHYVENYIQNLFCNIMWEKNNEPLLLRSIFDSPFKNLQHAGLTAIVKHDDHAVTWYNHGDSYSPWYNHGMVIMEYKMIMAWLSWNIA